METVCRLVLGLGMLLPFSLSTFAQTPAAPPAAVVVETEKIVESQARGTAWKAAAPGLELGMDDKLRTGEYSRALVRLNDLTTMRLDELTTIEISRAVGAGGRDKMDVKRGGFFFWNRGKARELEIRTASANGALKGTEFAMRVDADGKTTVAMFEGEFELSNAHGRLLLHSHEVGEVEVGRAPRPTSKIEAINMIQWCLYYPGVLDPAELGSGKSAAIEAYRAGDLPRALDAMKGGSPLFRAALILSSGQVKKARAALAGVRADDAGRRALERMIAAVQFRDWTGGEPRTASEWVAESYYKQSRGELEPALGAARKAIELSPDFGFAWVRAAEMEFSFGRTLKAMKLLERGLELAPRNAQALALQGFLLAAENRTGAARRSFDEAIAIDGALGNAWLGRGLTSIRQGREEEGRLDLQTAAVLEPNRSALRSYLGKAFSEVGSNEKANIELGRAKELDARDPTPWLYSAIQRKQENRYNEAVADLEKSIDLNKNRGVFRSKFLLDQDRSIRGTNLAAIYLNEGMTEQSVREAVRAVDANYASAPAHLFLANSYDALRDPSGVLTRYEAATFNELLLSHLLSPVGGGPLSQFVSQQEYSKLFEKDGVGFSSDTTYLGTGEIRQTASQFGTVGNLSFALDGFYLYNHGTRPNNRLSTHGTFATFKLQLGPRDTLFFQTEFGRTDTGDLLQRFDPRELESEKAVQTLDFQEKQDPGLLLAGWHRDWNPENQTLLLLGRLANRQVLTEKSDQQIFFRREISQLLPEALLEQIDAGKILPGPELYRQIVPFAGRGRLTAIESGTFDLDYRASFATYSAEIEHIAKIGPATLIAGARYQSGEFNTRVSLTNFANGDIPEIERLLDDPPAHQDATVDFERVNVHVYNVWRIFPRLSITGGLAYDWMRYPDNFRSAPVNGRETSQERISPKAGLMLEPWSGSVIRGAYAESISGASFDESIRLEPAQVAGFVQSYRGLASESLVGAQAGSRLRIGALSLEQKFRTRTYFGLEVATLAQDTDHTRGDFELLQAKSQSQAGVPSGFGQKDQYREDSITATINQLIGERWSLGARYRYAHSELRQHFDGVEETLRTRVVDLAVDGLLKFADRRAEAALTTVSFFALYNHPGGFFARAEANWYVQDRDVHVRRGTFIEGGSIPHLGTVKLRSEKSGLAGDEFWQVNALAGWRFHRNQCEVSVGVLNLTDQDYRLDPLNPHEELPRERTVIARCKLSF